MSEQAKRVNMREWADIRDRAEACERYYMSPLGEEVITRDVPRLLAEIERLTAAREGLAALVEQWRDVARKHDAMIGGQHEGMAIGARCCADALAAWLAQEPGEK